MKRVCGWLCCFLLMVVVSPIFAQRPEGGPGGPGGRGMRGMGGGFGGGNRSPYRLLMSPQVQEELALTDQQKSQGTALLTEMGERARSAMGDFQSLQNLSEDERRAAIEEMQKKTAQIQAEFKPKFAAVLDDIQAQRLQQIAWQAEGAAALRDPELAKALGLSQDQQDQLAKVFAPPSREGGPGRPQDGQQGDFRERFAQMQQQRETDAMAVLTAEQKSKLSELKGAPFDVSQLRGGGPGGGFGGGRPGGNRPDGGNRPNRPGNN